MTRIFSRMSRARRNYLKKRLRGRVLRHESLDARNLLVADIAATLSPSSYTPSYYEGSESAISQSHYSVNFDFQSYEAEVVDISYPGTVAQSEDITFKYPDQSIDLRAQFPGIAANARLQVSSVSNATVFEATPRVSDEGKLEFRVSGKPGFSGQSSIIMTAGSMESPAVVVQVNVNVENDHVDDDLDEFEMAEYALAAEGEDDAEGEGSDSGDGVALGNLNVDPYRCGQPASVSEGNTTTQVSSGNATTGNASSCPIPKTPVNKTDKNPHPIISVHHTLPLNLSVPSQITAQLTLGTVQGPIVYYDTTGLQPGDELTFALQVDATTLPTGRYAWEIEVTEGTGGGARVETYDGFREVINRVNSEFGNRNWIDELDRLYVYSDGVSLIRGDGSAGWFEEDGIGGYDTPSGSVSTLSLNYNGSYTLAFPNGSSSEFSSDGLITARIDRYGNEQTYSYIDADSDSISDELYQVIDVFGRATTYSYSSGLLQSITDYAGRSVTYQYTGSGFLSTITQPDPDGAGPKSAPVTTFLHDSVGRITKKTDPVGRELLYSYDFAGRVVSLTADGAMKEIVARDTRGLVDVSLTGYDSSHKASSSYLTVSRLGTSTDELGQDTVYDFDAYGNATSITDPLGSQSVIDRNELGLVTQLTLPDPDGAGPLSAPSTGYTYDTLGNLTLQTNPDLTTRSFTYETTFWQMTSLTDELGRVTLFEIDPTTGDVLEVRQVVGDDDRIFMDSDDVVVTYSYTDNTGSLPAGLLLTTTDPLGVVTLYDYDDSSSSPAFGWLESVTVAYGTASAATTYYEYDAAGNVTAVVDPIGRRTEFEYDNLDRLIAKTLPDPDGAGPLTSPVYQYHYDAVNQLISETDPLSRVTEYEYDERGRLITVTRPDHDGDTVPTVESFTYDDAGQLIAKTDALGRVTEYEYDLAGRVISITEPDPDGAGGQSSPVTTFAYDALGQLVEKTDPLGNVIAYEYDIMGRQTKVILPDPDDAGPLSSPEYQYAYDYAGQLISTIDPLGRETNYSYDQLGRVVSLTLPDPDGVGSLASPVQSTTYDKLGRALSTTDPLGKVTSYTFDTLGRLTQVTAPDPDGAGPLTSPVTTYSYDIVGQLLSLTDPMSRTTTNTYDALGRMVLQTLPDPDGAGAGTSPSIVFEYDAAGNLTAQEDALSRRTTYAYNALNWRTSVTDPASGVTTFTYDDVGNLLSLTDPEANTTSWTYDNLDRQISESNELSLTRSFSFDLVSNLLSQTDRNGRVTEYDYDNLYRMLSERWIGSGSSTIRTLSYEYDAAGQLVSVSDPSASYDYIYDDLGRVTEMTQNLAGLLPTIVLAQAYDANSRRTQLSATIGSTDDYVNSYSYDALGRLTQLTQGETGYGNSVAEKRVNFSYNASSQFASINRYADLAGTMAVAATAYSYDGTGRLTALDHARGLTTFASYGWTFDEGNRILQFVSSVDGTVDYTYDANQQLTGADYDYQTDESYTYDENGNRTNSGYYIGDNNQTLSDGTYDYEYDDEGNRTKKTVITTGAWTEYVWDHRNRLTQVVQKNSGGSVLNTIDYQYDVFDRRIARISTPAVGAAISQHFVYDGDHIALQFNGGTLTHRYLHGPVVDQILADEQVGTGDVLWPLTDNLGSVRDIAIYNTGTDTTTVANHIVYDAFGRVISETNSAVDLLFGYTARDWDAQAELQYNRARWYDPKLGQWLSEDPIGFEAGDANVRRYVGNGVTGAADPSGLQESPSEDGEYIYRDASSGILVVGEHTPTFSILNAFSWPDASRGCNLDDQLQALQTKRMLSEPSPYDMIKGVKRIRKGIAQAGGAHTQDLIQLYGDGASTIAGSAGTVHAAAGGFGRPRPTGGAGAARTGKGAFRFPAGGLVEPPIGNMPDRVKWQKQGGRVITHAAGGTTYVKNGISVKYNSQGFPDFSPFLYKGGNGKSQVRITLTKSRPDDVVAANAAAGFTQTPRDFTWHHNEDPGLMQLVQTNVHKQFWHTGGFSLGQ